MNRYMFVYECVSLSAIQLAEPYKCGAAGMVHQNDYSYKLQVIVCHYHLSQL